MRSSKTEAGLSLLGGAPGRGGDVPAGPRERPASPRVPRRNGRGQARPRVGYGTGGVGRGLAEKAGDFSAHLSDRAHDFATNVYSRAGDAADAVGESGSGLFERSATSAAGWSAGPAARQAVRRTTRAISAAIWPTGPAAVARRPSPAGQSDRPRARPRPRPRRRLDRGGVRNADARRRADVRARPRARPRPAGLDGAEGHAHPERLRHHVPPHRPRPDEPRPRHCRRGPRRPAEPARLGRGRRRRTPAPADPRGDRPRLTYPTAIQLMADANGGVTVYGRVPSSEEGPAPLAIHAVPGVNEIINRVESCSPRLRQTVGPGWTDSSGSHGEQPQQRHRRLQPVPSADVTRWAKSAKIVPPPAAETRKPIKQPAAADPPDRPPH